MNKFNGTDLDSYIGYSRPEIITEDVLKRLAWVPFYVRVRVKIMDIYYSIRYFRERRKFKAKGLKMMTDAIIYQCGCMRGLRDIKKGEVVACEVAPVPCEIHFKLTVKMKSKFLNAIDAHIDVGT